MMVRSSWFKPMASVVAPAGSVLLEYGSFRGCWLGARSQREPSSLIHFGGLGDGLRALRLEVFAATCKSLPTNEQLMSQRSSTVRLLNKSRVWRLCVDAAPALRRLLWAVLVELLPGCRQFAGQTTRVAKPELSGMSRLRSGQSTLDAWVRPFRRTTLQLRLRTQESAAALSPGTVPSTIRTTSQHRQQLASPMRQPPNPYRL